MQSAILILVAWTWGDWNWRKLTLWSGVEKGKTRGWVGRGVIWDVPQLSILWEFVRNMLKIKSSRAFYLSKRCTSKRILTIYKGFAENKYYKLFGHPTIFITPTSPSTSRGWFKVPQTNNPLVVLKSFDGVTFTSRVRQMVHSPRVIVTSFYPYLWPETFEPCRCAFTWQAFTSCRYITAQQPGTPWKNKVKLFQLVFTFAWL